MCLCIQHTLVQESWDQYSFVSSPKLFADLHALHRLLMPRHPPYTLNSLTTNIQLSQGHQTTEVIYFPKVNLYLYVTQLSKTEPLKPHALLDFHQTVIQINDIASFL